MIPVEMVAAAGEEAGKSVSDEGERPESKHQPGSGFVW